MAIDGYGRFESALYEAVHGYPKGVNALADLLGIKPGTLQNKANPSQEHQFTLPEYIRLLEITGQLHAHYVLSHMLGFALTPITPPTRPADETLFDLYSAWNVSVGETHKSIHESMADGVLVMGEFDRIMDSIFRDFDTALLLLRYLRSMVTEASE